MIGRTGCASRARLRRRCRCVMAEIDDVYRESLGRGG